MARCTYSNRLKYRCRTRPWTKDAPNTRTGKRVTTTTTEICRHWRTRMSTGDWLLIIAAMLFITWWWTGTSGEDEDE